MYWKKEETSETIGPHGFFTPSQIGLYSLGSWRDFIKKKDSQIKMWLSNYLELTTYEISITALRDSSLAPEGKTVLIISNLIDYDMVGHFYDNNKYEDFKEFAISKICQIINDNLIPGLVDRVEFIRCSTPIILERITGNSQGAITG